MSGQGELLVRLVVGTVLGALIGYERHRHRRPAGLQTRPIGGLASATSGPWLPLASNLGQLSQRGIAGARPPRHPGGLAGPPPGPHRAGP
jgi:hypothetical protein